MSLAIAFNKSEGLTGLSTVWMFRMSEMFLCSSMSWYGSPKMMIPARGVALMKSRLELRLMTSVNTTGTPSSEACRILSLSLSSPGTVT